MGCHFSGIISDIVEPVANNTARTFESISTEDCIARQEEYNTELESGQFPDDEGNNRLLLGADACALFPSLDASKCAKILMMNLLPLT